ncbi:cell division cycle protein 20 homolog B-like isoform X2 [Entelurus aequoreus]|nr:cell division cycle protein 20 homolog B-like isoform X2 [Entelurus aequoreus]
MQLIHMHGCQSPAASTPFTTGRRCKPNFEFDAVCQRLELDSPTRQHGAAQTRAEDSTLSGDISLCEPKTGPKAQSIASSQKQVFTIKASEQEWIWGVHEDKQSPDCAESQIDPKPFCVLNMSLASAQGKSALSGSALGNIHHHDPRAPAPPVGAVVQQGGVCSLGWSPGDEWLASGSPDGLLHVWDDIMGLAGSHQPVATMQQPSAVKAMGWCPWQRKMIATGGGWKDGKLRIWDTESATCVTSADSNSQICCLRWSEATRRLFMGHGRPHHSAICWEWDLSSLKPRRHLAGHSNRILHVASNPDARQLFTVGADQCIYVWDV